MHIKIDNHVNNLADELQDLCGVNVYDCYQCGKCSAGCTVSEFIQESPTRVIRLIQLNQKEAVFQSTTPYLCATCNTCSSRCPMEIDVAKLMESIRIASKKEGRKPAVKEVPRFSEIFLDSVKAHGRTYELGLTIKHNMANGTPLKDAELGPNMFLNGKLSLLPPKIKNKERIKKIFEKSDFFEPREKKDKGHH